MKTITKVLSVAVLTGLAASPAFAWGDREQGILTGIVGAQILRHVLEDPKPAPNPPRVTYSDRSHWERHPGKTQRPVVVREIVREPVVVYRSPVVVAENKSDCREVPVRSETGRILEFRLICEPTP
jgi:hypothetical protein